MLLCAMAFVIAVRCLIFTHIAEPLFDPLLQSLRGRTYQCGMIMKQTKIKTQTDALDLW